MLALTNKTKQITSHALLVAVATLVFLLCIQIIGNSMGLLGQDYVQYIVRATSNPSIGLFIGLLSTAILQSSSTTTSIAVAAVASGSLSLENAIPVVMGANVGTTLTSTIVSLSYVTKNIEFKKALSAGSVHDMFNVLVCLILFPLEVQYGILSYSSKQIASFINIFPKQADGKHALWFWDLFDSLYNSLLHAVGPVIPLIAAVIILFAVVKYISGILYTNLIGNAKTKFEQVAFRNTFRSFSWGFLLTGAIQSSSLTTSLIVPLVATGKVNLVRAFQFVMGANLGTTITALLAALFQSEAAIALAIGHFLFNTVGILLFLAIPLLRQIPVYLADQLALFSMKYRIAALAYVLMVFFIVPFTLIYWTQGKSIQAQTPEAKETTLVQSK